jgi:hypothetical protein
VANPADRLAAVPAFDPVDLRQRITALVDMERSKDRALRELAGAVQELLELAPHGSNARRLADAVLERPLARARALTAA